MPTILVTEDSMFLRIANQRILTRAGYSVLAAADGEAALSLARENHPDLILLDMMLPKISGPDVLHTLKGDPKTADIPVVVLTSLSHMNAERLRQEGAAAFLEKGQLVEKPGPLLETIRAVLDRSTNEKMGIRTTPRA
jgi:CheY-like chemotaxis protein